MPTYSAKQRDVLRRAHRRWNIMSGAVRSGKTFVSYDLLMLRLGALPNGNRLLIGKTERTLARNILDPLRKRFVYVSHVNNEGIVYIMGKPFYVAGANDEKSVTKIQGLGLIYAYGDEITTWNESFFQMLKSRLDKPGAMFDGTCNPESPYHWFKTGFLDKADDPDPAKRLDIFHETFQLDDNPFLTEAFRSSLKQEYTGVWYQRYILGQWCMADGAIYDMFSEAAHVIDDECELYEFDWITIDYGTANPCVFLHMRTINGRAYCLHEYYWDSAAKMRQKTDEQYADDLAAFITECGAKRLRGVYVDPSAASFITVLKNRNYEILRVDNGVADGIRTVAAMLATKRYQIHRRCKNVIREYSGYVWDPAAQKRGEDKPLKENDHCADAQRYFLRSQFKSEGLGVVTVRR